MDAAVMKLNLHDVKELAEMQELAAQQGVLDTGRELTHECIAP